MIRRYAMSLMNDFTHEFNILSCSWGSSGTQDSSDDEEVEEELEGNNEDLLSKISSRFKSFLSKLSVSKPLKRAQSSAYAVLSLLKQLLATKVVGQVTLVGHSMGAHLAGFLASSLDRENLRIVGEFSLACRTKANRAGAALDPAGKDISCAALNARLDAGDAAFVQVLHSNGAPLSSGGLGTMDPLGHVDFYVNGGEKQPFCRQTLRRSIKLVFDCE